MTSRDRIVATLAGLLVVVMGVALVVVVLDVQRRGRSALERERLQQVEALAANQDASLAAGHAGMETFANQTPLALEPGDPGDAEVLANIQAVFGELLESGFILLDDANVIVNGTLLPDELVGTVLDRPGLAEGLADGTAGTLAIDDGLTTPRPVLTTYSPVFGPDGRAMGAMLFEQVVDADSDFNREVSRYRAGATGFFAFVDQSGAVVASSDGTLLGKPFEDLSLFDRGPGVHRLGDRIHVVARIPTGGWWAVSSQDVGEFEEGLGEQVTRALLLLGVLTVLATAVGVVSLLRRLRAAREEHARLEELSASREEFISIVSHELRTPVAGVLGFLESTLDHWDVMDDDTRRVAVERAASNARRLQALSRDVLDSTAIEAGRLAYRMAPVDLAAEVRAGVEAALDQGLEHPLELEVPDRPVTVRGDAGRLHQVLANLLDNAAKNSPSTRPILVDLRIDGDHARLLVRDHGSGLSTEQASRVFDKFVRAPGSTVSGTGLGLYIVRNIVEAHGGTIRAASADGGGAAFEVRLPLASVGALAD